MSSTNHKNRYVTINGKQGIYDEKGLMLIPCIYDRIIQNDEKFICQILCYECGDMYPIHEIVYNLLGEQELSIDNNITAIIPAEYEIARYIGLGIIKVMQKGKWGLINLSNDRIIAPQFTTIDNFVGPFAKIGVSSEDFQDGYFSDNLYGIKNIKYGLINTSGEIVLPIEYDDIKQADNGYLFVKKNNKYQVLSPSLHIVINELCCKFPRMLGNRYIIVDGMSNGLGTTFYYLLDIHGNVIIPNEPETVFLQIEELKNGFLKAKRSRTVWGSDIDIWSSQGKKIYSNSNCEDISLVGDKLLYIKKRFDDISFVYNIANLQGKELFEEPYQEIRILDNGNFLVRRHDMYGAADYRGRLFIHPSYSDEKNLKRALALDSVPERIANMKKHL